MNQQRAMFLGTLMCMTWICLSVKSTPTSSSPLQPNDLNTTEVSSNSDEATESVPEPRQQLDVNAVFSRIAELENQILADRRDFIFKFGEMSSKVNALRNENLDLRMEKQETQHHIDRLNSRLSLVEDRWKEKRWQQLPDSFTDQRREVDILKNKLETLGNSLTRLSHETTSQDAKLRQTSESIRKDLRGIRKEFSGYSAMTFVFAQQTSQAINATESRLKDIVDAAVQRSQNIANRLNNRYERLEDQANLAISRLDLWNVTRQLGQCQKSTRDNKQDKQLKKLNKDYHQIQKFAERTYNNTGELQRVLYLNNQRTNQLSTFETKAEKAIKQLITNIDHLAKTFPTDCSVAFERGARKSGVYVIPNFDVDSIRSVQCQFTDTEGWTVIQNRQTLDVNFNRKWLEYEKGFGDARGDYWLGLEMIRYIVSTGEWKLRIEMWDIKGDFYVALYTRFYINDRDTHYSLNINGYRGNASDTLSRASGSGFSATDFDTDSSAFHCARFEEAGWWMRHCHESNLNGRAQYGMIWYHTPSNDYLTLVRTRMLIAPVTEADLWTTPPSTTSTTTPTSTSTTSSPTITRPSNVSTSTFNQSSFEEYSNETDTMVPDLRNETGKSSNMSIKEDESTSTVPGSELSSEYYENDFETDTENFSDVTSLKEVENLRDTTTNSGNYTKIRETPSTSSPVTKQTQAVTEATSVFQPSTNNQQLMNHSTPDSGSSTSKRETITESTPKFESSTGVQATVTEPATNLNTLPSQSTPVKKPLSVLEFSNDNKTSFERLPEIVRHENDSTPPSSISNKPDYKKELNGKNIEMKRTEDVTTSTSKKVDVEANTNRSVTTIRTKPESPNTISSFVTTAPDRPVTQKTSQSKSSKTKNRRDPKEKIVKRIEEAWDKFAKQDDKNKQTL